MPMEVNKYLYLLGKLLPPLLEVAHDSHDFREELTPVRLLINVPMAVEIIP